MSVDIVVDYAATHCRQGHSAASQNMIIQKNSKVDDQTAGYPSTMKRQ